MSPSPSFQSLLERIASGDAERAAELIVSRFASRLAALVARKMSPGLRQRVSPSDVVQSVFATFFRRYDGGEVQLRDWESLWGLLAQIAVCRVCRLADRHSAGRREMGRETPLHPALAALDREPGPADVSVATDLCESLLAQLSDKHRAILQALLGGATHEEAAETVGTSLSTVDRALGRARSLLHAMLADQQAD